VKHIFKSACIGVGIALSVTTTIMGQDYGLQPIVLIPEAVPQPSVEQPAPVPHQGIIGFQAGFLSGGFITSRLHSTEVLIAALGVRKSSFGLQLQLNSVYTVEGLACYIGVSGMLTSGDNPQIGVGVPCGLIYQMLDGPTFFMEFGPQIISGTEFEINVQATARVGIPL